jgi:hypothetical protein
MVAEVRGGYQQDHSNKKAPKNPRACATPHWSRRINKNPTTTLLWRVAAAGSPPIPDETVSLLAPTLRAPQKPAECGAVRCRQPDRTVTVQQQHQDDDKAAAQQDRSGLEV